MASIIACPGCRQDVTLPEELDGSLICPHCEAEFRLQAVLVEPGSEPETRLAAGAAEAEGSGAAPRNADAEAASAAPAEASANAAGPQEAAAAVAPEPAEASAVEPSLHGASADAAGTPSAESPPDGEQVPAGTAVPSDATSQAATATEGRDTAAAEGAAQDERITIHVPDEGNRRTATAPVEDFSGIDSSNSDEMSAATMAARATARRRRKGPGLLGHVVGIVGGGFVGLALGYYLLNLIGGERFNFLNIWLPGIRHTQKSSDPEEGFPPFPEGTARPLGNRPPRNSPPQSHRPRGTPGAQSPQNRSAPPVSAVATQPPAPGNSSAPAKGLPTYTPDELVQALAEARAALLCSRCRGLGRVSTPASAGEAASAPDDAPLVAPASGPCPECGGQSDRPLTPGAYDTLCGLAEVLTFVRSDDGRAQQQRDAVQWVFRKATETPQRRQTLARLGAAQLTRSDRPGGGIVLLGRIRGYARHEQFHLMHLEFPQAAGAALVVSASRAPYEVGTAVVVAGSLITDPARVFGANRPTHSQVVVGGLSLRVDEP